jgi:hypothetical protein
MRKSKPVIILLWAILISLSSFCVAYATDQSNKPQQNQAIVREIEKLNREIQKLKQDMDQSYYSVPKKEFEKVTVQNIVSEVTAEMTEKFNFWRNFVGFIIGILSFLGIRQLGRLREDILKNVDDKATLISVEHKLSIKNDISAEMVKVSKTQEEELAKIVSKIGKEIDSAKEEIKFLQGRTLRAELDRLKLDEARFSAKDLIARVDPLLGKAIELRDKELVNDYLDELFRLTFLSSNYEQLDKLRMQYEKDYEFKVTAWANIAIGDMFLYEENSSPVYKERALSAYKNALEMLPDYGTAYAVRLIIHMIDYEREQDQKIREREKREALNLINTINSGSSLMTSSEVYDYFLRIYEREPSQEPSRLGKYVSMLHKNFPEQMKNMEARYNKQQELLKGKVRPGAGIFGQET